MTKSKLFHFAEDKEKDSELPIEATCLFILGNIRQGTPQFVAILPGAARKVAGRRDVRPKLRPLHAHCGMLGMGARRSV